MKMTKKKKHKQTEHISCYGNIIDVTSLLSGHSIQEVPDLNQHEAANMVFMLHLPK